VLIILSPPIAASATVPAYVSDHHRRQNKARGRVGVAAYHSPGRLNIGFI